MASKRESAPDVDALLRDAAFGRGEATERLLAAAVTPRQRWLAAVVLGARGHYARAHAVLERLARGCDAVLASLACSTVAAHRRQLGGHADARRHDAAALRRLPLAADRSIGGWSDGGWADDGADIAGAAGDALVGLAADAVGVGDTSEAERLLTAAHTATVADRDVLSSWRTSVRWHWVRTEVALQRGDPHTALTVADTAARAATAAAATRHAVKSELLRVACLLTTGSTAAAASTLAAVTPTIDTNGWDSLAWPAAVLSAQLDPTRSGAETAILHNVLRRSDPAGRIAAYRSAWIPSAE